MKYGCIKNEMKKFATISYVCRDNSSTSRYDKDECPVLETEALAIQETIKTTVQMRMTSIIMESDSQASNYIYHGHTVAPKHFSLL